VPQLLEMERGRLETGENVALNIGRNECEARTLAELNAAGIPTYAFLGPLLPHYRYRRDLLDQLFRKLKATGTTTIFAEHLNTSPYILKRIDPLLANASPEVRAVYAHAKTSEHRRYLSDMVLDLVAKYGFELRLGRVLDHRRDPGAAAQSLATSRSRERTA
jgi:DNA repair photolyase